MTAETEGRHAAAEFRRTHHLGTQPLGDLVALIEQTTGNDVAVLDVGPDEHGLTMRDRTRGAVFIAVARTRRPMRQRSTLAHELAHVVFEDWSDEPYTSTDQRHPHEIRADAFARHLLVPVEGVKKVVGEHPASLGALSRIVQLFGVSPAMAAIAMHQAGGIDTETKAVWMSMTTAQLAARFGWIDHYEALGTQSDTRRAPQKLLARAIDGYVENVVSAQVLATLRGVDVDSVVRGLSEEGIAPDRPEVAWATAGDLPAVEVDFSEWEDDADDEGNRRMTTRPIIDAGPALNFLAINKERLLISVTGPISTPETVRDEILGKAAHDQRFKAVERVWRKIPDRFLEVLADDPTPELVTTLGRISQQPWEQRRATAKISAKRWSSRTRSTGQKPDFRSP